MKETIKLGLILLIITVVSAGILAGSNELTKDKIAQIEMEGSLGAITEIFDSADKFEAIDEAKFEEIVAANEFVEEILEVYNGDEVTGYSIKTNTSGFDGKIVMVTGFSSDGEVVGMRLLEHTETPGLGAKAEEPEYTDQYIGKSASEEITIEIITGATITSKAVESGANDAREIFNTYFGN